MGLMRANSGPVLSAMLSAVMATTLATTLTAGLAPILVAVLVAAPSGPARAAELDRVKAFMAVTGYEVVIDSLQLGAMAGPGMVGNAPEAFGRQYTELARRVFDPAEMRDRAAAMLAAVLPDDVLAHGADFYASELGQRLVTVENASHMTDEDVRRTEGGALLERLEQDNPARVQMFRDLTEAIGQREVSAKAIVEMQVRYLLAAISAGAFETQMSEPELRQILTEGYRQAQPEIDRAGLISNAYTYRDLPDEDVAAYVAALREPQMKKVYEVLNAVQLQIMIERYEMLGARMSGLSPQQDL